MRLFSFFFGMHGFDLLLARVDRFSSTYCKDRLYKPKQFRPFNYSGAFNFPPAILSHRNSGAAGQHRCSAGCRKRPDGKAGESDLF